MEVSEEESVVSRGEGVYGAHMSRQIPDIRISRTAWLLLLKSPALCAGCRRGRSYIKRAKPKGIRVRLYREILFAGSL